MCVYVCVCECVCDPVSLVCTSVSGFVAFVATFARSARSDAVPHGPVGIQLHVKLTLLTGHLIVTRLLFTA